MSYFHLITIGILTIGNATARQVLVKNKGDLPVRHLSINQTGFGTILSGNSISRELNIDQDSELHLLYYVDESWWGGRYVPSGGDGDDIEISISYSLVLPEELEAVKGIEDSSGKAYDRTIEVKLCKLESTPPISEIQELACDLNPSRFLKDSVLYSSVEEELEAIATLKENFSKSLVISRKIETREDWYLAFLSGYRVGWFLSFEEFSFNIDLVPKMFDIGSWITGYQKGRENGQQLLGKARKEELDSD